MRKSKVAELERFKNRFEQYSRNDFEYAQQLMAIGDNSYIAEIAHAGQYNGAAQVIDRVIQEETNKKLFDFSIEEKTAHEWDLIVWGIYQRLIGLFMIFASIFCGYVADGDYTAALVLVPLGLAAIFTRQKWIYTE